MIPQCDTWSVNKTEKPPKRFEKTKYANLVRSVASGMYFARAKVAGKPIRASLETEQLSQRLPQFLARQRRDVLLVVSYPLEISDPQMQFIARNDFTLIDDEQYSLVAVRYQPRFPLQSAVGNSIPGDQ